MKMETKLCGIIYRLRLWVMVPFWEGAALLRRGLAMEIKPPADGDVGEVSEWVYTIRHVKNIPNGFFIIQGKVNASWVYLLRSKIKFAPETLLFGGHDLQREGEQGWTIIYRFMYKPTGWNQFPMLNSNNEIIREKLESGDIYDTCNFYRVL